MKEKGIYEEIILLKGIAIIGVILQHMSPPLINSALTDSLENIFAHFHMESFMFASGFLFGISRLDLSSLSRYSAFITKKFKRLMVPYFVLSGIILLLKYYAQQYVTLISPVKHDFWKHLFFNPVGGFATYLWFLYILFFIFLLFPILHKILRNAVLLFLFILIIYVIPLPWFSYFNHYLLRWFILFFCAGFLYAHYNLENINRYSFYLCIAFSLFTVLLTSQRMSIMAYFQNMIAYKYVNNLLKFIIAFMGTFAFYYFSVLITTYRNPLTRILKYLGIYSASIYLLHTVSMASIRIICLNILDLNVKLLPLISILIFISGLLLPIYFTKYIIDRFSILPPLILGVKKST